MFDNIVDVEIADGGDDFITRKEALKAALDWQVRPHEEVFNRIKAAIIARMQGVPKTEGWVSVKDRLPKNEEIVIGYTPCDGYMFIGFYRTSKFSTYEWSEWCIITSMRSTKKITKKVTHWMPLPPRPEVSE